MLPRRTSSLQHELTLTFNSLARGRLSRMIQIICKKNVQPTIQDRCCIKCFLDALQVFNMSSLLLATGLEEQEYFYHRQLLHLLEQYLLNTKYLFYRFAYYKPFSAKKRCRFESNLQTADTIKSGVWKSTLYYTIDQKVFVIKGDCKASRHNGLQMKLARILSLSFPDPDFSQLTPW